jgi:hypothetical protein
MDVKLDLPGIELLRRSSGPSLRAHIARERHVLMQIAAGRPLSDVLQELLRSVEAAAGHGMMASILEVSEDGEYLRHLAAPSLPAAYSNAIDGARIEEGAVPPRIVVRRSMSSTSTPIRYGRTIAIWRWQTICAPAGPRRSRGWTTSHVAPSRSITTRRARPVRTISKPLPGSPSPWLWRSSGIASICNCGACGPKSAHWLKPNTEPATSSSLS